MAKLSRAKQVIAVEVRYLRDIWESVSSKVRLFTTSHKILSMATQNCNEFERLVYIAKPSRCVLGMAYTSQETQVAK